MSQFSKNRPFNRRSGIDPGRRRLLAGATVAVGAVAFAGLRWTRPADAAQSSLAPDGRPKQVRIVAFDDHGKRLGERTVPMVVKTNAQWKRQLSPLAYNVTREAGTEYAFSGYYNKPDRPGFYRCVCCNNALYDAATQFHSGTGWPSFWQPIAAENVHEQHDSSFGMTRTAISCTRCAGHLGHVFNDGPRPTGLRYCMNSVALRFVPTGAA